MKTCSIVTVKLCTPLLISTAPRRERKSCAHCFFTLFY